MNRKRGGGGTGIGVEVELRATRSWLYKRKEVQQVKVSHLVIHGGWQMRRTKKSWMEAVSSEDESKCVGFS